MRLNEIDLTQRTLITEGWNDPRLTLLETQHIIPFITNVERYIVEAKLSPEQISQLFTDVEKNATAAGGNRSLLGKGADVAKLPVKALKFIDGQINKLGAAVQKAGPVENADAKFEQLKAKIGAKDSKVVKAIQGVSDWAKANPGKASIAVAVLTAAAAMAGGPLGGALAGFLARATKDLLQGEKLSTAAGKSMKTAVLGYLSGKAFQFMSTEFKDFFATGSDEDVKAAAQALKDAASQPAIDAATLEKGPALDAWNAAFPDGAIRVEISSTGTAGNYFSGEVMLTQDQADTYQALSAAADQAAKDTGKEFLGSTIPDAHSPEARAATAKVYGFLEQVKASTDQEALKALRTAGIEANNAIIDAGQEALNDPELKAQIAQLTGDAAKDVETMSTIADIAAPLGQGAVTGAASNNKKSTKEESKNLSSLQIKTIIEWCDQSPAVILAEGPLDAIKKGAASAGNALKKGAAAVGAKAAKVSKNITTKVTADKMQQAWVKAGKPTDSDAVANILRQQGVDDKVLAPVYKTLGAKLPPAPVAADPKAAAKPGAAPTATPGAEPAATSGEAPTATPGAEPAATSGAAPTAAPAAGAAPTAASGMDFKAVQQAVAKLSPEDATALVQHIDSLEKAGMKAAGAKPAPKNAAAGDTFEKAKGDIRKVQGGQKPMPPKTAATIASDLAKLAKGDKESGVAAAQKIMTFAKAGVDISKQQQAWVANAKAGERFLTQSVYYEITKMLKEHNLSWSDLGMRVHLLEGTNSMFGISYI
jgi:hypothetical protein